MKRMLLDATGSIYWMGGLYNRQGNLLSLSLNDWIRDNVRITVVTNPEFTDMFEDMVDGVHVKMTTIRFRNEREKKFKLLIKALLHRCRYVYPNIDERACRMFKLIGIDFIPDYQYYHFPENFSPEEYEIKAANDKRMASGPYPLVLTGKSNLDDFRRFVSEDKKNIYLIPFIADSTKIIRSLDDAYVTEVCRKHDVVPGRFIMTSNQFWMHKNHLAVLKAMRLLGDAIPEDVKFLFTGQLVEYRTDSYIDQIKEQLESPDLKDRCVCTGYLGRREQLALMKASKFVIQPSLFEGWGACLDDARVLDKQVILSDIPVNHEHDSEKCTYFDPHDEHELAEKIIEVWNTDIPEDTERGIKIIYEDARKYSAGFEQLFKEN
ncbi:Glycosyltransferase involved in cell wall bisynthesis [Lachnospiraceae bacterium XBB2008]|nr:Glycosyltransferase involved in cell wall bisynthesis [Lachnospiraceae bacterium XBB2008]